MFSMPLPHTVLGCHLADLIVCSVLFEMSLNTAAKLKDPTPLGLQGCGESLRHKKHKLKTKTNKKKHTPTKNISFIAE